MDAMIARAPSTPLWLRQSFDIGRVGGRIEQFLDHHRDQLPLWLPVAFGTGVAAWFALPSQEGWIAFMLVAGAGAVSALMLPLRGRTGRIALIAGLALLLGCADAWWEGWRVATPVVARPIIASFAATIRQIDVQATKERYRLTVAPDAGANLPPLVRVVVDQDKAPADLAVGDRVTLRARLLGPPGASLPGEYDFARLAWFQGLGATGKVFDPVTRIQGHAPVAPGFRDRLSMHVRQQIEGSAGGIAAAFATGDRGGIAKADEDAMRSSGLTHLLSISGLHVTAVVGAAIFITLRLLALSTRVATRLPLTIVAAGAGAAAGIGYTLLTGAEIPTIRSCVAAVLVVLGGALGRQAFTLRLVATGALVIMIMWPDAVVGPSFQLSFAAITSLIAFHEWPPVKAAFKARDERRSAKLAREIGSLLATGLVVEVVLAPIAFYHFHREGIYGALANIVAIPLTTFVTMPFEALAIVFDAVGAGAPFWWVTGWSLNLLLWIARTVAKWPGALIGLPSVPVAAYGLMLIGGLWVMLWRGRVRALGFAPCLLGAAWALSTPSPDLLVTGDGMHLAVRGDDGSLATLRPRAGDYIRSVMSERFGNLGTLADLDTMPGAICSDDMCRLDIRRASRTWRILATRSPYLLPSKAFRAECAAADIVVSSRRLPRWCAPHWLKADLDLLRQTGGLAVSLSNRSIETVAESEGEHPWVLARRAAFSTAAAARRADPARALDARHRFGPDRQRWPGPDAHARPHSGSI